MFLVIVSSHAVRDISFHCPAAGLKDQLRLEQGNSLQIQVFSITSQEDVEEGENEVRSDRSVSAASARRILRLRHLPDLTNQLAGLSLIYLLLINLMQVITLGSRSRFRATETLDCFLTFKIIQIA